MTFPREGFACVLMRGAIKVGDIVLMYTTSSNMLCVNVNHALILEYRSASNDLTSYSLTHIDVFSNRSLT